MIAEVRAGGGVLRRRGPGGAEFAVVHRPRYGDWTFPKGKAGADESFRDAALREVHEETGLPCELGPEITVVSYVDHLGRPKTVRYWLMYPTSNVAGGPFPNDEVDRLRWVSADRALTLLTYARDRDVLRSALAFDRPVYLVRHAKAGDRAAWTEDDRLRPLSKKGRAQAEGLVELFDGLAVDRILSSPYVRCMQTVRPLALDRALPLEEHEILGEGGGLEPALDLIGSSAGATVLCAHGDLIPSLVLHLADGDLRVDGEPAWKKGSTWVLERDGGRFTRARYVPPPPQPA